MDLVRYIDGDPPEHLLVAAAAAGDLPKVASLLNDGVSVDSQHSHYKHCALHAAAETGHAKIVELLLDRGADINLLDDIEMTPLMHACSRGQSRVALLLIAAGADVVHERSSDQMSALKFALWGKCSRSVMQALIAKGAKEPEVGFPIIHLQTEEPRRMSRLQLVLLALLLVAGVVAYSFVLKQIEGMSL